MLYSRSLGFLLRPPHCSDAHEEARLGLLRISRGFATNREEIGMPSIPQFDWDRSRELKCRSVSLKEWVRNLALN